MAIVQMCDVECYKNFFLVKFYDRITKQFTSYRLSAYHQINLVKLRAHLLAVCLVTFNGTKYDMCMIAGVLAGFTNEQLKFLSDSIIQQNMQPWQVEKEFNIKIPKVNHIDLIEVTPGIASLKIYGARLHCKKMQDLPYEITRWLTLAEMDEVDLYCGNDLVVTEDVYAYLLEDIVTREELTEQYGIDMRSKSDAQISETAFKKILRLSYQDCERMKRDAYIRPGARFKYETPSFIRFSSQIMQQTLALIESVDFTIGKNGSPEMPVELDDYIVRIGTTDYRMGIGGLHSCEERMAHRADGFYSLVDVDVVSYYPKIISILRMFPHQIGEVFLAIYDGWIEVRIEYKTAGNKKKAATFKIKINGTYGKLGSPFSILYAPNLMVRTTITGQLSLFMLIERLEAIDGISVVSANTDGVVIKCRRDLHAVRDAVVKRWELDTGFETEANEYLALFSRDINNYLAFKPAYTDKKGVWHDIEVKAKGAYADPGLAKNPANIVCVDAVKEFIKTGKPVNQTIRECTDIRKFVTIRQVKGAGDFVHDTIEATTVGQKREVLTRYGWAEVSRGQWQSWDASGAVKTDDAFRRVCNELPRTYLGKAVRWYYGAGQRGHIAYASNGNLVARSEGATPCMDLPDVFPTDIDYAWYEREAADLLHDLNCC